MEGGIPNIQIDGYRIIASTENAGISVKSTTDVKIEVPEIYVSLTGDQVALTNIRVKDPAES